MSVQSVVFQDSPDESYQPMPIKEPDEGKQRKITPVDSLKGKLKGGKIANVAKACKFYDFNEVIVYLRHFYYR